jgi:catechol 2,3-dioxygenase-like lactoylglutathione lyase family enzyme
MAVKCLSRLGLTVRRIEMMAQFYQKAFGCQITSDIQGDGAMLGVKDARLRCLSLSLGQQVIELASFDPAGAAWPDNPWSNDFTFQHFAIVVSNMAKAYLHLLTIPQWTPISANGPVELPKSSGGVTAFKFRDPEGHPLELLEFPDKPPASAARFYEINHSAIVVKDTERSLAFYAGALGLLPGKASLNHGAEQAHLDNLDAPRVRVTPLMPAGQNTPHVELLCYQEPLGGQAAPNNKNSADAIATRMMFAVDDMEETRRRAVAAGGAVIAHNQRMTLLRDPDGHDIVLQ